MGKIKVDFRNAGAFVARATVQDGNGWRQISWLVQVDAPDLDNAIVAAGKLTGGLYEEKARVQNGASVPKGGM